MGDRRAENRGHRERMGLTPGGVGGTALEPARGRRDVAERNPLCSPAAEGKRECMPVFRTPPSYDSRSNYGNRSILEVENGQPEIETEFNGAAEFGGNRIVDMSLLSAFIQEHMICKQCITDGGMKGNKAASVAAAAPMVTRESRSGLASCVTFECANNHCMRFWTSPNALGSLAGDEGCGTWGSSTLAANSPAAPATESGAAPPPPAGGGGEALVPAVAAAAAAAAAGGGGGDDGGGGGGATAATGGGDGDGGSGEPRVSSGSKQ